MTSLTLRAAAQRCGLRIGAAAAPQFLQQDPAYGATLAREFSMLTPENAMKAAPVHPAPERYAFAPAEALVAFAQQAAMAVRGHTLVWHQQLPAWALAEGRGPREWRAFLEEHILAVAGHFAGKLAAWDVVNEAVADEGGLRDTPWLRALGPEYLEEAFRLAHAADPHARLFYNDYGAEGLNAKSDAVFALARQLVDRGVPLHGIGLQMHIPVDGGPPLDELAANMERLGGLGLDVHVTELDVRLPVPVEPAALERQARVYGDILDVCLAAPRCTALVLWGFTDCHSWVPAFFRGWDEALIFDREYRPKPAYQALLARLARAARA